MGQAVLGASQRHSGESVSAQRFLRCREHSVTFPNGDECDHCALDDAESAAEFGGDGEAVKCGTFGGVEITPEVRAIMNADRAAAEREKP